MADTKISALTVTTPVVGTMKIPMATAALANGSITPTGILAYGTDPVTGTTITATTQLVGAKVSESVTAGAGWTITAGTATTAVSPLAITQTWNNGAITFPGITYDVTATARANNSNFLKITTGGSTNILSLNYGTGNPVLTVGAPGTSGQIYIGDVGFGASSLHRWASTTLTTYINGVNTQNYSTSSMTSNVPIIVPAYAIASLPTGVTGMVAYVTDQITAAAAKGVAPTAGGAIKCLVFYNGSAWVGA